jgi:hypothetical protein
MMNHYTQEINWRVGLHTAYYADTPYLALQGANLQWANLEGANLQRANLEGANLQRANLEGANLEVANTVGTTILSIPAIGSSRKDNIYASPVYTDGLQTGWGFHLGCYYSDSYPDTRARIVGVHGDGIYAKCLDLLWGLCLAVFNPKDNSNE